MKHLLLLKQEHELPLFRPNEHKQHFFIRADFLTVKQACFKKKKKIKLDRDYCLAILLITLK